jgi:putative membrane protein
MMTRLVLAAVSAVVLAASAEAQTAAPSVPDQNTAQQTTAATAAFLANAAMVDLFEIRTGLLALKQADGPAYLDFAELMIGDHTKMRAEIDKLAATLEGVRLPQVPDDAHKAKLDQLGALSGAAFERSYKSEQMQDHKEAVAMFRDYAKSGDDAEVKSWAAQTLPMLEADLKNAEQLPAPTPAPTTGDASPGK